MQQPKRLVSSWSARRPRASELTPEEQAGVRRALKALAVRFGTTKAAAKRMGCSTASINLAMHRAPSVALALLAARAAGVSISDVLGGKFPREGECPLCGQVTVLKQSFSFDLLAELSSTAFRCCVIGRAHQRSTRAPPRSLPETTAAEE